MRMVVMMMMVVMVLVFCFQDIMRCPSVVIVIQYVISITGYAVEIDMVYGWHYFGLTFRVHEGMLLSPFDLSFV
jgi:hypothetical protein